ncbi:MAG: hypothetical protein P4L64_18730 [Caulobacteraceae bacterium]|nr:hypothetical protein [Caulobacteraceae bacterium]
MLQIITYMLAFYFILKGVEILQIGLASNRENRKLLIGIGVLSIIACVIAASAFVSQQDSQAESLSSRATPSFPGLP